MLRDADEDVDAPSDCQDYELPPELWDAWQCFQLTWHQWRVIVGWSGFIYDGIDQAGLLACMQMLGIKKSKRANVLMQVQVMESEARRLRNAK